MSIASYGGTGPGARMRLFKPIAIRGMELKNRIVMLPMNLGFGIRNRRARAYYVERARGGVGAIITGGISVDLLITDDAWQQSGGAAWFVQRLRQLTAEVHEAGAKIGMQLWHGNRYPAGRGDVEMGAGGDIRGERVAPSAKEGCRELTIAEIESIIARFALAAAAAKQAGFDFVEVHGAYGWLPSQFFSPADNRRADKYGGDLARRMRFGLECTRAIRGAVGADYPIFYRLAAEERRPGGITLSDAIEYAIELEKSGVAVFDVTIGGGGLGAPNRKQPMGTLVPLAEAIRKRVSVPVIGVGRINAPEVAEDILSKGKVDLVGIGRQLIADPFWPKKMLEGRANEIVACDSCNTNCLFLIRGLKKVRPDTPLCKFNHRVGREWEISPPE